VPINLCVRKSSSVLMDYVANSWVMVFWCILAIPKPMKMTHNEAVRAGLGMLATMGDLNTRLQPEKGIQLALRVGSTRGWL